MLSSGVGFFSPVKDFFAGTPEHNPEGWYKNVSEVRGKRCVLFSKKCI